MTTSPAPVARGPGRPRKDGRPPVKGGERNQGKTRSPSPKAARSPSPEAAKAPKSGAATGQTARQVMSAWARRVLRYETVIPAGTPPPPRFFSLYSLSPLAFAAIGVWPFWRFAGADGVEGGWTEVDAVLLLLQAFFSYMCDVWSFGRASVWKPLDRLFVMVSIPYQFSKLFWLPMRKLERLGYFMVFPLGIACYVNSMAALKNMQKSPSQFFRWHTIWHFSLPLGAALWLEVRWGLSRGQACSDFCGRFFSQSCGWLCS